MRASLLVLTTLLVVVIAIVAVGAFLTGQIRQTFDAESKAFVNEVMPKILSNLHDKDVLLEYASPELRKAAAPEDWDKLFTVYRKLGKIRRIGESTGSSNTLIRLQRGGIRVISTATYIVDMDCENGPAKAQVVLYNRNDTWCITTFKIDSKAFLDS